MTSDTIIVVFLLTVAVMLFPRKLKLVSWTGRPPAVFGIANWVVLLLVAVASTVVSLLLLPKPKGPKPASVDDLQEPTNSAGREIMKVWGEGVIKSGNILWFGDKGLRTYKVKV